MKNSAAVVGWVVGRSARRARDVAERAYWAYMAEYYRAVAPPLTEAELAEGLAAERALIADLWLDGALIAHGRTGSGMAPA